MPNKLYWFLSGILELLLIFFYSIIKMQKPSDQLTKDDVNDMRRGNKPGGHNGNDWRYRGSRGKIIS